MARFSKKATMSYWYAIYGLILVLLGWLLWSGTFSLEQTVGAFLVLIGLKKVFMGHCNC